MSTPDRSAAGRSTPVGTTSLPATPPSTASRALLVFLTAFAGTWLTLHAIDGGLDYVWYTVMQVALLTAIAGFLHPCRGRA
jgi:hypothetical protein